MGANYYEIPSDDARYTGQIIRTERLRRGLTQAQMGERMQLSTSYISSLERGQRRVSWHVGRKLYECFGISCDSIIAGSLGLGRPSVLRERTSSSEITHRMNVLLDTCSDYEYRVCYNMCSSFLRSARDQGRPPLHGEAAGPQ